MTDGRTNDTVLGRATLILNGVSKEAAYAYEWRREEGVKRRGLPRDPHSRGSDEKGPLP